MTGASIRGSVLVLLLASVAAACGGSTTGPSGSLNLTGTWSGVVGMGSGGGRALRMTWMATQQGSNLSGPVTVRTSPALPDTEFSGTLAGAVAGNSLSLTLAAQPQAASGCSLSGTGSASPTTDTISGHLNLAFVACGTLEPPSNSQLVLTKE